MGLFSSKHKDSGNSRDRDRDQGDPQWSFRGGSGRRVSGRAVEREARRQNPNGWRRSGKW